MKRLILLCSLLLLVAGCQAQAVKTANEQLPSQPAVDPFAPLQGRFDELAKSNAQVEQRITLMQEQMIKLNQQMQILQQRNLQLLQGLQQMQLRQVQKAKTEAAQSDEESGDVQSDEVKELVEQLQQMLSQQQGGNVTVARGNSSAAAGFKMVSAYTPKGQWVIFKYDEATGLSWTADNGGWNEVDELESMPLSVYQVVLRPAAGDVKGYVAARIDRETGQTWWLKGNSWEPFQ